MWAKASYKTLSTEMSENEIFQKEIQARGDTEETKTVYTDGGCIKEPGGTRAGYGVYWGEADSRNEAKALRGKERTAQRAEVAALARALQATSEAIKVVSDSRCMVDGAQSILEGKP